MPGTYMQRELGAQVFHRNPDNSEHTEEGQAMEQGEVVNRNRPELTSPS